MHCNIIKYCILFCNSVPTKTNIISLESNSRKEVHSLWISRKLDILKLNGAWTW